MTTSTAEKAYTVAGSTDVETIAYELEVIRALYPGRTLTVTLTVEHDDA